MKDSPTISPRWLRLTDAVDYSAIGKKRLVEYAKKGVVSGFQDPDNKNAWIFDRLSIDRFRESQNPMTGAKNRALEIMRSVCNGI